MTQLSEEDTIKHCDKLHRLYCSYLKARENGIDFETIPFLWDAVGKYITEWEFRIYTNLSSLIS